MTRDGARPPTTRRGEVWLEWRHDAGKPPTDPPPGGPNDNRPPRGPVQPPPPNPSNPDLPRPGRLLATIAALLLLAKHRSADTAGEPLGSRRDRPHHPDGWHVDRDEPAAPAWPGGRRPPLRTNLEDPK